MNRCAWLLTWTQWMCPHKYITVDGEQKYWICATCNAVFWPTSFGKARGALAAALIFGGGSYGI